MQMTIKHYEKTVLLNGRYYEEPKKEAWSARKKLPSKESVRRTRSRLGGALRGIGVLPNKQKSGGFLSRENRQVCRKGTTRHCLQQSGFQQSGFVLLTALL